MPEIITDIETAVGVLNAGYAVAIPTETVYGLAANAFNSEAVAGIYALKQRPAYNPLIVHIRSYEALGEVAGHMPEAAHKMAKAFWPGPLTLVLPKKDVLPEAVTAGLPTVAVRVPDHEITLQLLNRLDYPLAAPSANLSGRTSPVTAAHVQACFGPELPYVLEGGRCRAGIESTIIGFKGNTPILYRAGALPLDAIEAIAGPVIIPQEKDKKQQVCAPGMLSRHYAPLTPIIVAPNPAALAGKEAYCNAAVLLFNGQDAGRYSGLNVVALSKNGDNEEACHNLYACLHELDSMGLDLIIAEPAPDSGLGRVINDRLTRAAAGSTIPAGSL